MVRQGHDGPGVKGIIGMHMQVQHLSCLVVVLLRCENTICAFRAPVIFAIYGPTRGKPGHIPVYIDLGLTRLLLDSALLNLDKTVGKFGQSKKNV